MRNLEFEIYGFKVPIQVDLEKNKALFKANIASEKPCPREKQAVCREKNFKSTNLKGN